MRDEGIIIFTEKDLFLAIVTKLYLIILGILQIFPFGGTFKGESAISDC
jgi:hypothetical protein